MIRSFVLRQGRMSIAQRRSYNELFPLYCQDGASAETLDLAAWFAKQQPLVVEIGFGMGTATSLIAAENPGINYLGIEVHKPGIGRLLWEIEKQGLQNIRILEGDAAEIINSRIGEGSIAGFHIFFPDPWPKKRHHKRRLIKRPFTEVLASKLIPGGYLYMVSDWIDYSEWALAELSATSGLVNAYQDYAEPQPWRPKTEFEKKGLKKGHEIRELLFNRRKP